MRTISSQCLGCLRPFTYEIDLEAFGGAPDIIPPYGSVAYRNGHLCGGCGRRVEEVLRAVRNQSARPGATSTERDTMGGDS